MKSTPARGIRSLASGLLLCVLLFCTPAGADEAAADSNAHNGWDVRDWKLQTSFYTKHWSDNPDHSNHQHLINLEAGFENNWVAGGAYFDNSFGQPSWFAYMGYQWPLLHSKYWYFKLVGGLLYGYKEPYEDKIPLNGLGIAPAILPIFGVRYKWAFTELSIAGTAAITISGGFVF